MPVADKGATPAEEFVTLNRWVARGGSAGHPVVARFRGEDGSGEIEVTADETPLPGDMGARFADMAQAALRVEVGRWDAGPGSFGSVSFRGDGQIGIVGLSRFADRVLNETLDDESFSHVGWDDHDPESPEI